MVDLVTRASNRKVGRFCFVWSLFSISNIGKFLEKNMSRGLKKLIAAVDSFNAFCMKVASENKTFVSEINGVYDKLVKSKILLAAMSPYSYDGGKSRQEIDRLYNFHSMLYFDIRPSCPRNHERKYLFSDSECKQMVTEITSLMTSLNSLLTRYHNPKNLFNTSGFKTVKTKAESIFTKLYSSLDLLSRTVGKSYEDEDEERDADKILREIKNVKDHLANNRYDAIGISSDITRNDVSNKDPDSKDIDNKDVDAKVDKTKEYFIDMIWKYFSDIINAFRLEDTMKNGCEYIYHYCRIMKVSPGYLRSRVNQCNLTGYLFFYYIFNSINIEPLDSFANKVKEDLVKIKAINHLYTQNPDDVMDLIKNNIMKLDEGTFIYHHMGDSLYTDFSYDAVLKFVAENIIKSKLDISVEASPNLPYNHEVMGLMDNNIDKDFLKSLSDLASPKSKKLLYNFFVKSNNAFYLTMLRSLQVLIPGHLIVKYVEKFCQNQDDMEQFFAFLMKNLDFFKNISYDLSLNLFANSFDTVLNMTSSRNDVFNRLKKMLELEEFVHQHSHMYLQDFSAKAGTTTDKLLSYNLKNVYEKKYLELNVRNVISKIEYKSLKVIEESPDILNRFFKISEDDVKKLFHKVFSDFPKRVSSSEADDIFNTDRIVAILLSVEGLKTYVDLAKEKDSTVLSLNYSFSDGFKFEVLDTYDPTALSIGAITSCCQLIGGAGEASAIDSFINPLAGVLVLKNDNNEIVSQSYFHYVPSENGIILDNVEKNGKAPKNINEYYALLGQETKKEGFAYLRCGLEYNKLDSSMFGKASLKDDPRHFEYEKKYSDFDKKHHLDLFKSVLSPTNLTISKITKSANNLISKLRKVARINGIDLSMELDEYSFLVHFFRH